MSHIPKLFLKIITNTIYVQKIEQSVGETQFGFRNDLVYREALFALSGISQDDVDDQVCFTIYTKIFEKHSIHFLTISSDYIIESGLRMFFGERRH